MNGSQSPVPRGRKASLAAIARLVGRVQERCSPPGRGVFVAVVGPSGAGKDTLISFAKTCLKDRPRLRFVKRVVTRPASDGHEDHASLTDKQFQEAVRTESFALHWQANGLHYGVTASADLWFASGDVVVANLSRGALAQAVRRYSRLAAVHVTVPADILAQRLSRRGRENEAGIAQRLARAPRLGIDPGMVLTLDNSGPVEQAGTLFVRLLEGLLSV